MDTIPVTLHNKIVYDSSVRVLVYSDVNDPTNFDIGYMEGFRFIESPNIPEPPRARQKMDAFIHRKLGHYGF